MPEPAPIIDQIQKYILPDRLVEKNIALSPEDSQQVILFYLHLGDARFLELAIDIIPENMKDEKLVYNYLEKTIESIGDFKIIPENTELKLIEVCKRFKDEKYACCILELIAESTNKPIAHSKIIEIALNSEYSEYEITKILKAVAKSSTDHNINSQILDIALKLEEQSDKIYIIEDLLKSTTDEEILQKILVVAIGLMNPILIKMVLMLIIENNNNPNTLRDALELAAVYQFKDIILKAEVIQVKSNFDPKNIRKTIELALNYKEEGETSAILQEVTKLTDDQNTHLEILGIAKQFKKKSHASDLLLAIAQSTTNKTVHLQILEHSYNEDILKSIAKSTKDQDIQLQILEIALGNEYLFEISPILEAIAESTTHEEILTRIRNEAKKFNDKFWTIDLLKATIKSTTELDTLLEMINIAIGINIENYTSDLLVKIANVGRVEIFSEIVNITKNFKDIDYTLSVISALTERYANILIEQSQKDANANPIVFFRQNIEPLIFQFSDLKHRAIIINTFLKSIKTDINANLIDESKESDIDQNNHKPKSKIVPFKRVDLSIPLAKLIYNSP